jgi:hypothetical protein
VLLRRNYGVELKTAFARYGNWKPEAEMKAQQFGAWQLQLLLDFSR